MCSSSTLCPLHTHAYWRLSSAAPAQILTASCSRKHTISPVLSNLMTLPQPVAQQTNIMVLTTEDYSVTLVVSGDA